MTEEERKTVTFQIEKKDYDSLRNYAKYKKKVTVSWMLRDLVSNFIEKLEK